MEFGKNLHEVTQSHISLPQSRAKHVDVPGKTLFLGGRVSLAGVVVMLWAPSSRASTRGESLFVAPAPPLSGIRNENGLQNTIPGGDHHWSDQGTALFLVVNLKRGFFLWLKDVVAAE